MGVEDRGRTAACKNCNGECCENVREEATVEADDDIDYEENADAYDDICQGADDDDLVSEYFRICDLPYIEEEIVEGST